jgi:hypothetical protein
VNFRVFFQFDDSALRAVSNAKFSNDGACGSTTDQIMPRPETAVHTVQVSATTVVKAFFVETVFPFDLIYRIVGTYNSICGRPVELV